MDFSGFQLWLCWLSMVLLPLRRTVLNTQPIAKAWLFAARYAVVSLTGNMVARVRLASSPTKEPLGTTIHCLPGKRGIWVRSEFVKIVEYLKLGISMMWLRDWGLTARRLEPMKAFSQTKATCGMRQNRHSRHLLPKMAGYLLADPIVRFLG